MINKVIYLIRHCKATGQAKDATLTEEGRAQADALASFLVEANIERIVSSPFTRALQSIEPLAKRLGLEIETDTRLIERVLSSDDLPNWLECVQASFSDPDLCFEGGESSRSATERGMAAIQEILAHDSQVTAVVSHGNLSTLLLMYFDKQLGFETWAGMTNPDVFRLIFQDGKATIERTWKVIPS